MVLADHHRRHKGADPAAAYAAGTEQLHRGPHFLRIFEVHVRDLRDPFRVDILEIHLPARGHSGENGDLAAGVVSLHVRLRVALRVAQVLGLLQRALKGSSLLIHLGQDEIGGAV